MGNYKRNSDRPSGGFGRGGFGGRRSGGSDRGFGGGRGNDRPTMHDAICSDCGMDCQVPFRPTGNKPVLCSDCFRGSDNNDRRPSKFGGRSERRDRSERPRHEERQMHDAVCDNCHEDCQVPFRPTGDKPIFCDSCFGKGDKPNKGSRNSVSNSNDGEQLKMLNAKLDKLISILAPQDFTEKTEKPKAKKEKATKKEEIVTVEAEEVVEKPKAKAKKEKAVKKAKATKKTSTKKKK